MSQVWFVTGASTGFGLAVVKEALAQGHKVVATLRKPEVLGDLQAQHSPEQLLLFQVDVTQLDQIKAGFAKAKEVFGRIDVVFNNAGLSVLGEIESVPEEVARNIFEVNFWGALNVSKVAMDYFRQNTPIGGKLLQVSSNTAISSVPVSGYYSATKCALEGISDSLSQELDPAWNIKVTILEPGPFNTDLLNTDRNCIFPPPLEAYAANESLPVNQFRKFKPYIVFDGNAGKAAKAFVKLAALEEMPTRFPLHRDAIAYSKRKAQALLDAVEKWESWSEDVYTEGAVPMF